MMRRLTLRLSPCAFVSAGAGSRQARSRRPARRVERLRDELARSRARAQLVKEAIYTAKLSASFRWKGAPDSLIHRAELRLDGGDLWNSGDKAARRRLIKVAESGIKPGPHELTLRLEIRPAPRQGRDKLGYVSEHTFAIIVPDGKTTGSR